MGGFLLRCRELWVLSPYHEVNFPYLQNEAVEPNVHSSPIEHKHSNALKARRTLKDYLVSKDYQRLFLEAQFLEMTSEILLLLFCRGF